jgi:hypothetical protein
MRQRFGARGTAPLRVFSFWLKGVLARTGGVDRIDEAPVRTDPGVYVAEVCHVLRNTRSGHLIVGGTLMAGNEAAKFVRERLGWTPEVVAANNNRAARTA